MGEAFAAKLGVPVEFVPRLASLPFGEMSDAVALWGMPVGVT